MARGRQYLPGFDGVIYYEPRFGLGNVVQTTPAFRYLERTRSDEVAITINNPNHEQFVRAVYADKKIVRGVKPDYTNCVPENFELCGDISEVRMNLLRVGAPDDYIPSMPRHADQSGAAYEQFDIVLCDGYNKRRNKHDWLVKSYAHWKELAQALVNRGLSVASVGEPDECIQGAVNRTSLSLLDTFGLIKNCKRFISNDTGLYHVACALGVPTIVVFTMSDITKNYDPHFHASAKIATKGLSCQPCQLRERNFWLKNEPRCGWACRDFPTEEILELV